MSGVDPNRIGLYLVTDTALCGGFDGVLETVSAAAANGADIVQLRDHHATTRELCDLARQLMEVLDGTGVPLVVDDRLDVALAVGADGVHLGQSDLDPVLARRLADAAASPGFHIGLSVSNAAQVAVAEALPTGTVDLLGIGPFRATPTKPDAAAPLGLHGVGELARAARGAALPGVVIGGVKRDDVPGLIECGAHGVAVVSAICGQPDPGAATLALRESLEAAFERRAAGDASDAPISDGESLADDDSTGGTR